MYSKTRAPRLPPNNAPELLKLRKKTLLDYARARIGELKGPDGKPIEKPLARDIDNLVETLDARRNWIYRTVKWLETHLTAHDEDFKVDTSDGGKGQSRKPEHVRNAARESIFVVCVEQNIRPRSKKAIDKVIAHMIGHHGIHKADIPARRSTICEWMTSDLAESDKSGELQNRINTGKSVALMDTVFLSWTDFHARDQPLVGLTAANTVVGILNLTCGVEAATLMPWGWLWCAASPTSAVASECLYHGLLSKRMQFGKYGQLACHTLAGTPSRILCEDNLEIGPELSAAVEQAGLKLVEVNRAQLPDGLANATTHMYRAFVAHLRRQQEIIELGKTLPTADNNHTYIRCKDVAKYWIMWIATKFIDHPHPCLGNKKPRDIYKDIAPKGADGVTSVQECRTEVEDKASELKWHFWKKEMRKVNQMGIQISSRLYADDPETPVVNFLGPYFPPGCRTTKEDVEIRRSYFDLNHVLIPNFKTGKPVAIPLKAKARGEKQFIECNEWEWQTTRKDARRAREEPRHDPAPNKTSINPTAAAPSASKKGPVIAISAPAEAAETKITTPPPPVVNPPRPESPAAETPPKPFPTSSRPYNRWANH